jgi:hypothetical protein
MAGTSPAMTESDARSLENSELHWRSLADTRAFDLLEAVGEPHARANGMERDIRRNGNVPGGN